MLSSKSLLPGGTVTVNQVLNLQTDLFTITTSLILIGIELQYDYKPVSYKALNIERSSLEHGKVQWGSKSLSSKFKVY